MAQCNSYPNKLVLKIEDIELEFRRTELKWIDSDCDAPRWAKKNNKSLRETLQGPKYAKLATKLVIAERELDLPLGDFLLHRKLIGNESYKLFLNPFGDLEFGHFQLDDPQICKLKGLYAYTVDSKIVYVGRCLDSFGKRINHGYGKIHPKNCFIDGQSTNCRLNALATMHSEKLEFFVCPKTIDTEIREQEIALIRALRPPWNKQLT